MGRKRRTKQEMLDDETDQKKAFKYWDDLVQVAIEKDCLIEATGYEKINGKWEKIDEKNTLKKESDTIKENPIKKRGRPKGSKNKST